MVTVAQRISLVLGFVEALAYVDVLDRPYQLCEEKYQNLNHGVESSPNSCLDAPRKCGVYPIKGTGDGLSCDVVVDAFGPLSNLSPGVDRSNLGVEGLTGK